VDSTNGVVGAWNALAKVYPQLDVDHILSSEFVTKSLFHRTPTNTCLACHGVRTVDTLRKYCGIEDPVELHVRSTFLPQDICILFQCQKQAERFEQAIITSSTENGRKGIVLLPGAATILDEVRPWTLIGSWYARQMSCFPAQPWKAPPETLLGDLHLCRTTICYRSGRNRRCSRARRICNRQRCQAWKAFVSTSFPQ
jgi:hypothetical protein